jgi:hypothetical protein
MLLSKAIMSVYIRSELSNLYHSTRSSVRISSIATAADVCCTTRHERYLAEMAGDVPNKVCVIVNLYPGIIQLV